MCLWAMHAAVPGEVPSNGEMWPLCNASNDLSISELDLVSVLQLVNFQDTVGVFNGWWLFLAQPTGESNNRITAVQPSTTAHTHLKQGSPG